MSESDGKPPSDEWIQNLYQSDSDAGIPLSTDEAILKHAQATLVKAEHSPRNWWLMGTAASAVFGVMLIMQIQTTEVEPAFSSEALPVEELTVTASRKNKEPQANKSRVAKKLPQSMQSLTNLQETKMLPAMALEANVERVEMDVSSSENCITLVGNKPDAANNTSILQCQSPYQVSFQIGSPSDSTCNQKFVLPLEPDADIKVELLEQGKDRVLLRITRNDRIQSLSCKGNEWHLSNADD